jgi:hypothetical protein
MLSSLHMWSFISILSNEMFALLYAMMETMSCEISHFTGLKSCIISTIVNIHF